MMQLESGSGLGRGATCWRSGSVMWRECRIRDIYSGWEQGLHSSRQWHGAPTMLMQLDCHK
jgi:hypothetical protein